MSDARMKSCASFVTFGSAGKSTFVARSMTCSDKILSWVLPSPNGRRPYSIWKKITPTDHTSTFEDIRGDGWKHSGGKYQYVPAPCDVSSMEVPSAVSSMIFDKPKSVIFTSPISSNKILPGLR